MWRSLILTRSQPLLSHLRRRRILPRRYASHARRPRRHLYVVLDEIDTASFSVYKLNIDDLDGGDEDAVNNAEHDDDEDYYRRLPKPVLRLGYSTVGTGPRFEALGGGGGGSSKIVVTGIPGDGMLHSGDGKITLVYDTRAEKLDLGHPLPAGFKRLWHYHAAAAGDALYTLADSPSQWYCLHELQFPARLSCSGYHGDDGTRVQTEWAWDKMMSPPPDGEEEEDRQGDGVNAHVESYAVHPNGRTIFVSCCFSLGKKPPFTFSMDTAASSKSRRRHDWSLPFKGRGFYDGDLDAWVGVREDHPYGGDLRLCSCDVPDDDDDAELPLAPAWKRCEEKLTFMETEEEEEQAAQCDYGSRALVHTGRGRFCLAEAAAAGEDEALLHVTMFRAKHGKNGELLAAPCRPGRSYVLPKVTARPPIAFWM